MSDIRNAPVTCLLGVLAIAMTLWWWQGEELLFLTLNLRYRTGLPVDLVTSIFPHLDPFHLLFNLYWLWRFGACIEPALGSLRFGGMVLLLAASSSAAQTALDHHGIGLSGVGYGLFGFLWMAGRRDGRFRLDQQTIQLFIAWFFLCIALTWAEIWRVGNIAHGAGLLLGLLLGGAKTAMTAPARRGISAALAVACLALLAGATIWRPSLNRTMMIETDWAHFGYLALLDADFESARNYLTQALDRDSSQASWWYNLGIAYQELERDELALEAYRKASELDSRNETYKETFSEFSAWMSANRLLEMLNRDEFEVGESDDPPASE